MNAYSSGFFISLSLIFAIGAQNAFILRQGLKKQYIFLVCSICVVSDALLITFGVLGFSTLITSIPWLETAARYGGAAFLFFYGIKSLLAAFSVSQGLEANQDVNVSLYKTVSICLAFTWLNPHTYLDTVIFIGSISTQFEAEKLQFTLGAISASFLFFFSLGYGARILIPIFKKPLSWKILDIIIAFVMFTLAMVFIVN
jgi:L-lysine exporter family protein LysE/ArgO